MKKLQVSFIFIFVSLLNFAQVGVGPDEYFFKNKVDDFEEEALVKLKASKTVFLYGKKDNAEELEKTIKSVWTLTEISMLPYTELDSIDFDSTSIFSIEESGGNGAPAYLQLWMQETSKKGKKSRLSFCKIGLHANGIIKVTNDLYGIQNNFKSKATDNFYSYFYSESRFET